MFWLLAVRLSENLPAKKLPFLWQMMKRTYSKPVLIFALISGFVVALVLIRLLTKIAAAEFHGAPFHRFLRGTEIVRPEKLKRQTRSRIPQVTIADIPIPIEIEPLHFLINGATGTGKSVLFREMAYRAILRGDRVIALDPNADMMSKFYRKSDVILNPYDKRTKGWSFYNEIRGDYDFHRYALSLVPRGRTSDAEEWAGYGRLLLREAARKLHHLGNHSMHDLFKFTSLVPADDLKKFLTGTLAESLFAGSNEASKALTSARFVLSDKLTEHVAMPSGDFSIRTWLETADKSNLFITWREDMSEAIKPLISAWTDVVCTSMLSLPENPDRRIWLFIDELASLEKLASLEAALTKGRKHGLRIVAGLQSTSQLNDIYGREEAQTIRSCFRSLAVLGGSRTDPKTNEDMSQSLGEHEVERVRYNRSVGTRNTSTSHSTEKARERVIMPAEIAQLPNLTAYLAFAGGYPIVKAPVNIINFANVNPTFEE
jgi:hypothetical protein